MQYSKKFFDTQAIFKKTLLIFRHVCFILARMNWTSTINDLLQRGHTFASIGREIGTTGAAVRAMMLNKLQQPRWSTGNKLISLHKRVMRKYPRFEDAA